MTVEEMRIRKTEMKLTYEKIAEKSGVPAATVKKILGGFTKFPRHKTVLALEKVFSSESSATLYEQMKSSVSDASLLREPPAEYGKKADYQRSSSARDIIVSYPLLPHKRQGEYTEEDRDLLPDDCRTELIDGVLYDLASPITVHQLISMEISFQLRSQIEKCGNDCYVFAAPSDVKISYDNRNILQPDLYVICDTEMIRNGKLTLGPPPFVIEVLSPSTRGKDILLKSWKYATSGVKEYWMVDPDKRIITVKDFEKDPQGTEYTEYGFDDTVPVGISGGHCKVDFGSICKTLDRLEL